MRFAHKSEFLTAGSGFLDPRSKIGVRLDGSLLVRLEGRDKSNLRADCLVRDRYTCTKCGRFRRDEELDMHHIQHLGEGGGDILENVTTRCKWGNCHRGEHGQVQFHWSKSDASA
jgi:hypothetical protein